MELSVDFIIKTLRRAEKLIMQLGGLNYRRYAGLFVPDYTVERYGSEVVAAEALREYGWNRTHITIVCPDEVRTKIWMELETMKRGLFLVDTNYFTRCRKQFRAYYEGKTMPEWEGAKDEVGVVDNRSRVGHIFLFG